MEVRGHMSNIFDRQTKIFYRPIDAALRWCNLLHYEAQILQAVWSYTEDLTRIFPQWPCLRANTEKIYDAMRNGELPYGCLGISVPSGSYVESYQITVRHSDLRFWMQNYHPDQRPAFLFGLNNESHSKISVGDYIALQADRDTLLQDLQKLKSCHQKILEDIKNAGLDINNLKNTPIFYEQLSERSEITYQSIIGAMLNLFLEQSPAGKPLSVFNNQAAIVDAITARYTDIPGLSKRTLDEKFAAANRSLRRARSQ